MADKQVVFGGTLTFAILEDTPVGPNALIDTYYIDIDTSLGYSIKDFIKDIEAFQEVRVERTNVD